MMRVSRLWLLFFVALAANCMLWPVTRDRQAAWLNVPPVPSLPMVRALSLGDEQLAYRGLALVLQNLGDLGGRITPLYAYDYDRLGEWFFLMHRLDPRSDYIPYVAAHYFGSVNGDHIAKNLRPVVAYLEVAGDSEAGQKWRFLAHGVYLARFKMGDLNVAYRLAEKLAALGRLRAGDLPHWTRQMPAFILNAKGDKQAAFSMMMGILAAAGEDIDPAEVNHTRTFMCETILSAEEAAALPVCEGVH